MASEVYLSVVVPAFNEAARLPQTLRRLQEYLAAQSFTYEILVVLDGPRDHTRKVLRGVASEIKNLIVLDRVQNRGKGYAVREGMLRAAGHIRLFTDADNSTDISHFDAMRRYFDEGYDVVICSRNPKDAPGAKQLVTQKWHKRLLGNLGNLFVQFLAVRGIWDTQCGFKAFRGPAAEKIFSRAVIDGWGFDIEALALTRALGYRLAIVPALWINHPKSHITWSSYFSALAEAIRVRWNLSGGKYKS